MTLGPTDVENGPFVGSTSRFTWVQKGDGKRFVLVAPSDGVITTWRVNLAYKGDVKLIAMQPGSNGYTDMASTPAQTGAIGLNTFNVPLPVSEGQVIGLQVSGTSRLRLRPETGGVASGRNDRRPTGWTDFAGYYALFNADLQVGDDVPAPPGEFPPGDFPPGNFPPSIGLPQGGGGSGGSGGSGPSVPAPSVSGLSPASGSTAGGDAVAITGANFNSAHAVYFGGVPAQRFTVDGANRVTAVSPAHDAGVVDVQVVTDGGTSAAGAADVFRFLAPAAPVQTTAPSQAPPAQTASTPKRRVRCAHAPTLLGRTVSGARKLLRRYGCGSNLRIVMIGKRHGHRRVKVRSQVPAPRHKMRRDRRVLIRVR